MIKFNETPNIALDIETLSTQPTAAIISIAAKVFTFEDGAVKDDKPCTQFFEIVSAASCAMYGMHFDMDTVNWWERQSSDAKAVFTDLTSKCNQPINKVLQLLSTFISDIRAVSPDKRVLIWCQGTDFDIPILRHAYCNVMKSPTPWKHDEVRDARTFINGVIGLTYPGEKDPYKAIPKNPSWTPHDALSDVDQLIWNVCNVRYMFKNRYQR